MEVSLPLYRAAAFRIDRIVDPLAMERMVDKFSPAAEELCHYGTIDDMAAEILSGILLVMKQNTTFHPVDVAFFGTGTHVFEAKDLPHLIEQFASPLIVRVHRG